MGRCRRLPWRSSGVGEVGSGDDALIFHVYGERVDPGVRTAVRICVDLDVGDDQGVVAGLVADVDLLSVSQASADDDDRGDLVLGSVVRLDGGNSGSIRLRRPRG